MTGFATPTVAADAAAATGGAATTAIRSDAKLQVATGAPVTAVGATNSAGVAATLARSDHLHRIEVGVQDGGVATSSRPNINFIDGAGIAITVVDNGGSERADVTVALTGGTPGVANAAVQARRTTSLTIPTAYLDVDLQATDIETDSAVLDHVAGTPDRITAVVAGTYLVLYDMDIEPQDLSTNQWDIQARVRVNDAGTGVLGSHAETTIFWDTSIEDEVFRSHLSCSFVATLAAADFLTLQVQADNFGGGDDSQLRASGTTVKVIRLL
jgi:hypothetical protein